MKFTIITKQTKHERITSEVTMEVYQQICGLQRSGVRPQYVELSREELMTLLQNPKVGIKVVAAMSDIKQ